MSRFYRIVIKKKGEDEVWIPPSMEDLGIKDASYTSLTEGGNPNPSALDITLNLAVSTLAQPRGASLVRVFGVSLEDINQFSRLVEATIWVHAGMKPGLPLARPNKSTLITVGTIFWASGNWEAGSNLSVDLYILPLAAKNIETKKMPDLTFNWQQGQSLTNAVTVLLNNAYGRGTNNTGKGYDISVEISDKLVTPAQTVGAPFKGLDEFARALNEHTRNQNIEMPNGEAYDGVHIKVWNNRIIVYDNTKPVPFTENTRDKPLVIDFLDLIGQPSWKTSVRISFKTVMRADIQVGDFIKLPETLAAPYVLGGGLPGTAPNTPTGIELPSKNKLTFQGVFYIVEIHQIGQFRQADGRSWVTSFDAVAIHKAESKEEPEEKNKEPFGPPKRIETVLRVPPNGGSPRVPPGSANVPPPTTASNAPYRLFPQINASPRGLPLPPRP